MSDQQVTVLFQGGPNQTLDPRHLPPGTVVDLMNVNYDLEGTYQVRLGYVQLGPLVGASLKRMHYYQGELLANDGQFLWSYNDQANAWVSKDAVPQLSVTHAPLSNTTGSYAAWGEAVGSGYRVVVWIDALDSYLRAAVYSLATGALEYGPIAIDGATSLNNVSVGIVGTTAIVVWYLTPNIKAYTLALSPLGTWSAGTTISDGNLSVVTGGFAVAWMSATFVLCYQDGASGAAQKVRMRSFNSALTLQQNVQGNSTGLTGPFACMAAQGTTGENLWIAVSSASGATGELMNVNPSTLAAVAGPFALNVAANMPGPLNFNSCVSLGIARVSSTQCVVVSDLLESLQWQQYTTGGSVGVTDGAYLVGAMSQPLFMPEVGSVVMMARGLELFATNVKYGTHYLIDLKTTVTATAVTPRILAVLSPLVANNNARTPATQLPLIVSPVAGTYELVGGISRGTTGRLGLELYTIRSQDSSQWASHFLGKELYLQGNLYDGKSLVDVGQRNPTMTGTVNSGNTVSYQYCTTWGWIDAQGNLEESAPSAIQTFLSGAPPNVTISNGAEHLTNKQRPGTGAFPTTPIFMIVYRSPNLAAGDSTLYRVTKEPFPANCVNTLTGSTVPYTDTMSDATLTDGTHPVLYTMSGELPHNRPETFGPMVAHKNRIWGIAADRRSIWYSQTYVEGTIPAYHPNNVLTVDDTTDALTALASSYDKLLIFTNKRIYVVFGDGPSVSGVGSDLTVPQRIASGIGCMDSRSIVNTPSGVMFQSLRGIEAVGSDLTVNFVGLPVSVTTQTYPVCTSAVMCPNSSTVRFSFVTSETFPSTSTGVVVVYDMRRDRWTIHSLTAAGARAGAALAPVQSAVFHPIYGYVEGHPDNVSGGVVAREAVLTDAIPWNDFGQYSVPVKVTMAWIKTGDLQGWQRVRRVRLLAQYFDQHDMQLQLNYDYQNQLETHSWLQATIANLVSAGWEQLRTIPGHGKCEAIQCVLTMTPKPGVGTGRGAALTGVAFEIRPAKGGYRNLAAAAKG